MARQDIQGLLTGGISTRPNPNSNSAAWRLQFGQERADKMKGALRSTQDAAFGGPQRMSAADAIGVGQSQLDLTTTGGLSTLASLQQLRGDTAGAAKTASAVRDMKQSEAQRLAVSDSLKALGLTAEAQQVLDKTLSPAAAEQAAAAAALPITISAQVAQLKAMGVPADDPIYTSVQQGVHSDASVSDIKNLGTIAIGQPAVKRGESVKYIVDGKPVWGADTSLNGGTKQMMYAVKNADDSMSYVPLPATAEKYVAGKKGKGRKLTSELLKRTEGKLALSAKESGMKNNDAWSGLELYDQNYIAEQVADRTLELIDEGVDEVKASKRAIKEVYLNRVTPTGYTFGEDYVYTPPDGGNNPPQEAIDLLMANPSLADQFIAKYGSLPANFSK